APRLSLRYTEAPNRTMSILDLPPVAEDVRTVARFLGVLAIVLAAACGGTTPVAPTAPASPVSTTTSAPAPQPAVEPAPSPAPSPSPAPAPSPAPVTAITLASFTVSPQTLRGGDPTTGTLTLDTVAPGGGIVVSLSSESKDGRPPASVTVPAGSKTTTVTIDTAGVSGDTEVRINATAGGVTLSVQ